MGYKIYLASYDELVSFIDYATEMHSWGTRKFVLSTLVGTSMDVNTRVAQGGVDGYTAFAALRGYIEQYFINNGEQPIIVDVKLMCPDGYRRSIDPNGYYTNFFVNFYSSPDNTYINMGYEERGQTLINDPFVAWCAYIKQIHKKWALYNAE